MAHSREVRLPFLNHELVEFIFSLPASFKIREGWTKWILRKAYSGSIDDRIIWRKDKIGYEPPQKKWLSHKDFSRHVEQGFQVLSDHHILHAKVDKNRSEGNEAFIWKVAMLGNYMS